MWSLTTTTKEHTWMTKQKSLITLVMNLINCRSISEDQNKSDYLMIYIYIYIYVCSCVLRIIEFSSLKCMRNNVKSSTESEYPPMMFLNIRNGWENLRNVVVSMKMNVGITQAASLSTASRKLYNNMCHFSGLSR